MLVTLLGVLLAADAPAQVRTLSVAVVSNKGTVGVEGVTPEEVAVLENGAARDLVRFEPDTRPLTLAVIVDTSEPMASPFRLSVLPEVERFLTRLPAGTKTTLWTTGDRPTRLVDASTDPAEAGRALRRAFLRGGNTLLDALVEAAADLRKKEGERSMIVVVTGLGVGFTNTDRFTVAERVGKGDLLVAGVQFDEGRAPGGPQAEPGTVGAYDYEYVLSELTRRTGGPYERSLSAQAMGQALDRVLADLKGRYRLSYATLPELKNRKLEVKVARPDVEVRSGVSR